MGTRLSIAITALALLFACEEPPPAPVHHPHVRVDRHVAHYSPRAERASLRRMLAREYVFPKCDEAPEQSTCGLLLPQIVESGALKRFVTMTCGETLDDVSIECEDKLNASIKAKFVERYSHASIDAAEAACKTAECATIGDVEVQMLIVHDQWLLKYVQRRQNEIAIRSDEIEEEETQARREAERAAAERRRPDAGIIAVRILAGMAQGFVDGYTQAQDGHRFQGCCSHHGGLGATFPTVICRDGTPSPTCH